MIKKYCDVCAREIPDYEDETYSITIERNEETYENSKYYHDVCKNCAMDIYAYMFKFKNESGD